MTRTRKGKDKWYQRNKSYLRLRIENEELRAAIAIHRTENAELRKVIDQLRGESAARDYAKDFVGQKVVELRSALTQLGIYV